MVMLIFFIVVDWLLILIVQGRDWDFFGFFSIFTPYIDEDDEEEEREVEALAFAFDRDELLFGSDKDSVSTEVRCIKWPCACSL